MVLETLGEDRLDTCGGGGDQRSISRVGLCLRQRGSIHGSFTRWRHPVIVDDVIAAGREHDDTKPVGGECCQGSDLFADVIQ